MKYIKTIKYYSELIPLYISMMSVRSKKIYVFGSWQGQKFTDNSKYLYLEAIKDKSIKAIWITKRRDIYDYMRKKSYPVYMHNSVKGMYYQLRASIYFTSERRADISAFLLGNATRINLWHGVGLKKILHDDKITNDFHIKKYVPPFKRFSNFLRAYAYRKEYVISTSETMSKIFASAFNKPIENILELGQPRNDVFFDDSLELESIPFAEEGKKVILYMPTHRNHGKKPIEIDKVFNLPVLNAFCKENNLLFVLKKHFFQRFDVQDLSAYSNIIDITQNVYDTQQLLKKASVLITDFSSVYVDYLLLDRPVIFYTYDYDTYLLDDRELYFDYEKTTPGPKAKDFPSFMTCLEKVVKEEHDEDKIERERIVNIFYSKANQQKVSSKILDYVKENIK